MTKDANTSAVEQNNETKPADNENVVNQTADTGNDTPDSVPYARFNELNKKYQSENKTLKDKLESLEAKQEEARIKDTNDLEEAKSILAEKNAQLKELVEYKAKKEEGEAKKRESLLNKLSDEDKEMYSNLTNTQLEKHIARNTKNGATTDKSNAVRGATFNPSEKDIWSMDSSDRNKNWTSYLSNFTKKK